MIDDYFLDWLNTTFYKRIPPMPPTVPPPPKKAAPKPSAPPPTQAPAHAAKKFGIANWDGKGEGEKVIIYAASGRGKTTLASMAPKPVFIGLDDGGRKVRNPITGEPVRYIPGIESFQDVRDALHQPGLFTDDLSVVVDTGTILELLGMQWVIDNVPHEKGPSHCVIRRIEDYGYAKGFTHLFDVMRLFFQDCDALVRQGKNIIILCQQCPVVIANAAGNNYLQDGPKLYAPGPDSKQSFTIRGYACEWADHVFKIDYCDQQVVGARTDKDGKEHAGKVRGSTERAVYTMPDNPSYFAKTRTLTEAVISFSNPADDSLWRFLFPDRYAE
jgi:hypothetical protein